ncbi:MAG: oligosaccharide flippase family protein [Thiohalocapsa sp.]|nr:oligosaccharide flippase family protein [Thiohalocapsa sp.]
MKALAAVSVFAMNIAVTRTLGAAQAGLFFLAYTIVTLLATASRLGLDLALVRFTASYAVESEWGQIRRLHRTALHWSLTASILVACTLALLADWLAGHVLHKPQFAEALQVAAIAIPLVALMFVHGKLLQGIKRVAQSLFVLSVCAPLVLLALVLFIGPATAVTAVWYLAAATAAAAAIGAFWWFSAVPRPRALPAIDRRELIQVCMPLLTVSVLAAVVTWSSQLILGAWATSAEVAVFNAAQRTALLITFVLLAVNTIAAPKFAALFRTGNHAALRHSALSATKLMVLFSLGPLIAMLLFPRAFLMLFGAEFGAGSTALRILALGQFLNVATGSVGFLLSMTGHEAKLRDTVLIASVLAVLLGFALIPSYGITGAAIATAAGVATQNLLGVYQVSRAHGFNTLAIWR